MDSPAVSGAAWRVTELLPAVDGQSQGVAADFASHTPKGLILRTNPDSMRQEYPPVNLWLGTPR